MQNKRNKVFIATSLDGYIADKNGGIEWLHMTPNPDNSDLGYSDFTSNIDAIVMGRNTFETVCSFDIDWPYKIPLFVLSNSLSQLPNEYTDKAFLVKGNLNDVLTHIHQKGYTQLYIDGGSTVQSFLKEGLIDDLIITQIPIVLGNGIPLFSTLPQSINFELVKSQTFIGQLVQSHYQKTSD